eukprot:121688-Pyramimonas_sp.AAC.1
MRPNETEREREMSREAVTARRDSASVCVSDRFMSCRKSCQITCQTLCLALDDVQTGGCCDDDDLADSRSHGRSMMLYHLAGGP